MRKTTLYWFNYLAHFLKSLINPWQINSTHHMERIKRGYRWVYGSFSEQEMAYFSSADPPPAREVANHMNPAPSTFVYMQSLAQVRNLLGLIQQDLVPRPRHWGVHT